MWINLLSFKLPTEKIAGAKRSSVLAVRHYTHEYIIIISHGDTCTTSRDDDGDVENPSPSFRRQHGATEKRQPLFDSSKLIVKVTSWASAMNRNSIEIRKGKGEDSEGFELISGKFHALKSFVGFTLDV